MCEAHRNATYLDRVVAAPPPTCGQGGPVPHPSQDAREIAYVLMGYPRLSETFITHEIYQLERLGMKLRLFAVKRGDMQQVHEVVGRIRAPLTYLPRATSLSGTGLITWLRQNWPAYAPLHRRLFRARPGAYLSTLASTLVMCWRYRKHWLAPPRKVFVKEFLQAGHIAMQVIDAGGVRHLHGHFCHGATTITWMASRMTGLPFSFTAHAKDIYQNEQNPGDLLLRKLGAARFATTCTGANAEHLARHFPRSGQVHTVYHGLDTDYFSPASCIPAASGRVPQILAVGRFVEKKGFQYLLEACAILKNSGISFTCRMLGEKGELFASIQISIVALGLGDRVVLQDPVTHDALRALYRDADIFALPCLIAADGDRDGIPNVLAEAMSTGLAVVSTGISGIPELVRDGIDGLIVPQRDADALACSLRALLEDQRLRQRLGRAARERVRQVFDSRKTTLQLRNLFVEAMQDVERTA